MNIVGHSQGVAFGAGITRYLNEQGFTIDNFVGIAVSHSSLMPLDLKGLDIKENIQIGYNKDWVVNQQTSMVGVDKFG